MTPERDALPYPPAELVQFVGSQTEEDFEAIGREFLGYLVDLAGLEPSGAILDVGCGCEADGAAARGLPGRARPVRGFRHIGEVHRVVP